jgi:hypothetical protein
MSYLFEHTDVLSASIAGICGIVATLIAAVTASLIGKKIANRQKLQEILDIAKSDIDFLLAVERIHCERNKNATGKTSKNEVRAEVLKTKMYYWSGRFTSSRLRQK